MTTPSAPGTAAPDAGTVAVERVLALVLAEPGLLRTVYLDVRRALAEESVDPADVDSAVAILVARLRPALRIKQVAPDAHLRGVMWRLLTLSADARLVVALVAGAGVAPERVAELLGVSERQARAWLRQGLRHLGSHYGLRAGREDEAILGALRRFATDRTWYAGAPAARSTGQQPAIPLARVGADVPGADAPADRPGPDGPRPMAVRGRLVALLASLVLLAAAVAAAKWGTSGGPSPAAAPVPTVSAEASGPIVVVPAPTTTTVTATATVTLDAPAPVAAPSSPSAAPGTTTAEPSSPVTTTGADPGTGGRPAGGGLMMSAASDGCLTVTDGEPGSYVPVVLAGCGGGGQSVTASGDSLRVRDDMCLDVAFSGKLPGTPVVAWPCGETSTQQFKVLIDGHVVSLRSGLCMTVARSQVVLASCSAADPAQFWQVG